MKKHYLVLAVLGVVVALIAINAKVNSIEKATPVRVERFINAQTEVTLRPSETVRFEHPIDDCMAFYADG